LLFYEGELLDSDINIARGSSKDASRLDIKIHQDSGLLFEAV